METYEALAGEDISTTASNMVRLAKKVAGRVQASFNDVELTASAETKPADVVAEYWKVSRERSAAYERSPEGKAAKAEREAFQNVAALEAVKPFDEFQKMDEPSWLSWVESNREGYGACIMRYAARWANRMEAAIKGGAKVSDCASKCSHEADTEGITGFMYGAAVAMLAKCWVYGEQLRQWHNIDTQIGTEGEKANASGGVLNPAVLTIGA